MLRMRTFAKDLVRAAVVTLAVSVFVTAGREGTPLGPTAFQGTLNQVDIRQVLVQALVTDRTGHPIKGLGAPDFQILEDGVPQQIVSLTAGLEALQTEAHKTGAKRGSNDEGRNPPVARPQDAVARTYVICVDALHSSSENSSRVRDALSKYFKIDEKGRDSLYKLVVFGSEPVIVQKFTTNPHDVMEAVRSKEFQNALREGESKTMNVETNKLKHLLEGYCGKCPCGPAAPSSFDGACTARRAEIQAFVNGSADKTASLTNSFLRQLRGVVEDLATMPAERTLILISDGFTFTPGRELYGILSAYMPHDPAWKLNPRDAQHDVEPILQLAFARNIPIYTLDSRAVYATGIGEGAGLADASSGGSSQPKRPANLPSKVGTNIVEPALVRPGDTAAEANATAMEQLAHATGGVFFRSSIDLLDSLKRAFTDGREYYLITYTPKNQAIDGGFRQITVRAKEESWSVQSKAGYWAMNELPPPGTMAKQLIEGSPSAMAARPSGEPTALERSPASLDRSYGQEAGNGTTELASPKGKGKALVGTVRQVSGQTVIVELADTRFMVLQVNQATRFNIQGSQPVAKAGGLADSHGLRPGLEVRVTEKQANEHSVLAESIEVTGGSPSPPPPIPTSQVVVSNEPLPGQLSPDIDGTIVNARNTALRLIQALPNFTCLQTVDRWEQRCGDCAEWKFQDEISAEVLYSAKTGEAYQDVHVNHVRSAAPLGDLQGQVSTGEFASTVKSLFAATSDSDFQFIKETANKGAKERIYSYHVSRARSEWMISSDYQFVFSSYGGRVWIDVATGQIRKLERQAEDLPKAFPFVRAESEVEYGEIRLGDSQRYFLPIRGKSQVCLRDSNICTRSEIEFSRYRRYSGEATIRFQ